MAGERIHEDRADLYDPIYHWLDYAGEAERLHARLLAEGIRDGSRVVEGACGTGSQLQHLGRWYRVSGFDKAEGMLQVARRKLPEVTLWQADLEDFALEEPADVFLCLFSSIGYVGPLDALRRSARCVARALRPGGVAIVQPWFTPRTITPGHAGLATYQDRDLKLARANLMRVEGRRSIMDFHWLVARRGAADVEHFTDRHVLWLYTPREMTRVFTEAGLEARFEPGTAEEPLGQRGTVVARRPVAGPDLPT